MGRPVTLPPGESTYRQILRNYKYSAKRRGIEFKLTDDDCKRLFQQPCTYCDAMPSSRFIRAESTYYANGIDRIDNTKGYIEGNVTPCCRWCNEAKGTKTVDQFLEHVRKIYEWSIKTT